MEPISIDEIIIATGGKLLSKGENKFVRSVHIDSRKIEKDSLFVPIIGTRVDGHDFIKDCFEKQASACFTSKNLPKAKESKKTIIKVENTQTALTSLAEFYRKKFSAKIIGVTGSVGKTTTKEIISSALSSKLKVMKTKGNLNSQIGLPLTIFNLNSTHQAAVIEMGISEFGEMSILAKVAKPDIAVVTNIGVSHIENLKSKENIMKEKLHICDFLKDALFLNGDDELLKTHRGGILFGLNKNNDIIAENIKCEKNKVTFTVNKQEIVLNIPGKHNVYSSLAAIGVAKKLGLTINDAKEGLKKYTGTSMRQQVHKTPILTIIDDTYNASPDSIKSAVELANQVSKNKRKVVILADILELGENSDKIHRNIGKDLSNSGIDILITVGEKSKNIAIGIESDCKKYSLDTNKEIFSLLKKILGKNDTVLVKGSRGMKMEKVVEFLKLFAAQ